MAAVGCISCSLLGKCPTTHPNALLNWWSCPAYQPCIDEEVAARIDSINVWGEAAISSLISPQETNEEQDV